MAATETLTTEAAFTVLKAITDTIALSTAVPPKVGKIRLFNETLSPDPGLVKADFVAAETALVGYPAGGYSITDFIGPLFGPTGGAYSYVNAINVLYASGAAQVIGGYWVEDAAGDVVDAYFFTPAINLAAVGDGFPIIYSIAYGA